MPGLGEVLVTAPSAASLRQQDALAGLGQISQLLPGMLVGDDGADRHQQHHVLARVPGTVGAFAVAAAVGFELAIKPVAKQRVIVRIGLDHDAAAVAAVAAGGSAARDKFFAAKRHATIAAVAGLHANLSFINEHSIPLSKSARF